MRKRLRFFGAAFSLLGAICPFNRFLAAAQPLRLTSGRVDAALAISQPKSATLTGTCRLAVATRAKSLASVEYRLGSRRLGIAVGPPFELNWNTAYAADGSSAVQAIARDAFGKTVGSANRVFTIHNRGNSMTLTGPPLPPALHGTVALSFAGEDSRYYP